MRVGIDIDEVCARFAPPFLDTINEICATRLGRTIRIEDIARYDIEEAGLGITVADLQTVFRIMRERNDLARLDALPDAAEVLQQLSREHDIYYITGRGNFYPDAAEPTRAWLAQHGFPAPDRVILEYYKQKEARKLGIQVFVDDNPEIALKLADERIEVFLMDYPWNHWCQDERLIRVHNWQEIRNFWRIKGYLVE
jgi:uncharacterized HAD superfamily protein